MKNSLKLFSTIAFLATSSLSNAALTLTFLQSGNDVVATTSGSFHLGGMSVVSLNNSSLSTVYSGNNSSLYVLKQADPSYHAYNGGVSSNSSLTVAPDTYTGNFSFGYDGTTIYKRPTTDTGASIDGGASFIWQNQTLASIGLGGLTTTSQAVYTSPQGQTIEFVRSNSIPEPTSVLLLCSSLLGGLFIRRRS